MANFTYKALDNSKKIQEGSLTVKSKEEVAQLLAKKGLTPLTIKEIPDRTTVKGTIGALDKIIFLRYLSTMMSSGLSLAEGIDVLKGETKQPLMKRILGDMSYSLEQGQQLSTVFARYPNAFEPYFLTLTKAGEVSGTLADIFKYLEAEVRAEHSLSSKVKGALLYPAVVFSAMIGIGILMFFFVLPQIGKVFLNLKVPLPTFTKLMFRFSIALSSQVLTIIVFTIVIIVIGFFLFRKKEVRNKLFILVRPIPLIRNLIKKVDMARFNRIFSTLLRSAVPITEALEISLTSLTWYQYRDLSKSLPDEVRKGKTLSSAVRECKVFPSLMVQMIATGEKTGSIDTTLAELASFYEEEVQEELKSLTQILEPVLMLLVGVGVGVMILSIIAPIYSVVGSFQDAATGR